MRRTVTVIALLFLAACTDGRWIMHDLSRFSFQFNPAMPVGPFVRTHTAPSPLMAAAAGDAPRSLAAARPWTPAIQEGPDR